jgi:LysR family glycine cleavage system transcriptional activator
MALKIPPVHLLTIFEAAARLESFKLASEELFITPSAISHQVKSLEEYIGFELFQRKSRGVSLNSAGKMYLNYIQRGLNAFDEGTKKLKRKYASPHLKISCFSTLASNIIIPQMGAFQNAHPDIDIRIETGNHITDLRYDDIDLAIRVGDGEWPNVVSTKITDIEIAAVGSKSFIEKHQLNQFEDVKKVPLIDITMMNDIWGNWANKLNLDHTPFKRTITFSDYDSSIRAAIQGLGLALAMFPMEKINEDNGLLVKAFNENLTYPKSVYAVYRVEDENRHDIQCFLNWLLKSPDLLT